MQLDEKLGIIYETIAPTITRSEETWKAYLRFGGAVYKHSFDNALLVYAQNPKATMLADFDTWTSDKVGRSINKGEKGIAVCEYAKAKFTVKHLFDVSQTNGAKIPDVWKLDDELRTGLLTRLANSRGIKTDTGANSQLALSMCISQIVANSIADSVDNYLHGFESDVKDHFLGTIPQDGLAEELTETIYNSCVYYIANRCGIESPDVTMPTISHFDTVPLVARLGYTVTTISKSILLEIARNVKILESERSAKNERRTHEQHRTSRTTEQLGDGGRTGPTPRQVRQNGNETPTRIQPPKVFTFEDAGQAYEPDVSGGRGSGGASREDNTEAAIERPDAADRGHNGEDTPPEQAEGYSGGNSNLRDGADSPIVLASSLQNEQPSDEITEPEREPQGSFSLPEIAEPDYSNLIGVDKFFNSEDSKRLEWVYFNPDSDAGGQFVSNSISYRAIAEAAKKHDNASDFFDELGSVARQYLTDVGTEDFPIERERFESSEGKAHLIDDTTMNWLKELALRYYPIEQAANVPIDNGAFFMSDEDDESIIKTDLLKGSMVQGGKTRIYNFVKTEPTTSELAQFLKNEYGWGGHGGLGGTVIHTNYRSDGIHFELRDDNAENGKRILKLSWNDVAKRITELVNSGEYQPGKDAKQTSEPEPEGEGTPLWQEYNSLLYKYPDSIVFRRLGDFYEVMGWDAKTIADELGYTLTSRDVGLAEEVPMVGIPSHTLDTVISELTKRDCSVVVADADGVAEHTPVKSESLDEEESSEIDDYAIPDEPDSFGKSGGYVGEQQSFLTTELNTQPKKLPNDAPHRNYRAFNKLFPQIVDGTYHYLRLESDGFEPLSVERIGLNKFSIMHTYVQNGDLMRDPDMVIEINPDEQTVQALSYELSGMVIYHDVYAGGNLNVKLQKELNSFLSTWLKNIGEQEFMPVRAMSYENGEDVEISFNEQGSPLKVTKENLPDEKELHLRLAHETLNSHDGQLDCQIQAFEGENRVGVLYYSVFEDTPHISFIEAEEAYRRKGIGTALVQELAERFPGIEIEWGMLTDDGAAFKEAVTYEVENEEYNQVMTRLAEVVAQIEHYESVYSEGDIAVPNDVSEDWNTLHDEQYDLQHKLPFLFPVKTFIKTNVGMETAPIANQSPNESDFYRDISNYAEPFVIVEESESLRFDNNERLSFTEADLKFKEVEKLERQESFERHGKQLGYYKTWGMVYYLADETDTELSTHEFRYDIGDYNEKESGLFNHISRFWDYAEKRINQNKVDGYTREDVSNAKNMLGILSKYKDTTFIPDTEIVPDEQDMQTGANGSGGTVEITESTAPVLRSISETPAMPEKINYRYSEADNLFTGGAKTKFRNNIEAIRLVKHLESEGRLATADEQKILANYVGWGGLANAFSKTAAGWENEYQELKLILDEEEYRTAMNSTITAFYTEPKIAECMYKALGNFGFKGGADRTLVEPAIGTGIFYSVLPESLQETKLHGVELDNISGKIARQLYQNADIQIQGFETTRFEDDSVDVIIGNIPFNNVKVYDRRYEEENFLIHDYFIAKSLDLLKPGGIATVITSKGTMDKTDTSARKYFAQRADLIGAIRLPNSAFKTMSGTEVTADILFFKKLDHIRNVETSELPEWVYSGHHPREYYKINHYFLDNPDMILGKMERNHSMYGNQDGTACIAPEGQDLYAELESAIGKLSAVFAAEPDPEPIYNDNEESPDEERMKADDGTKNYTYVIKDGEIYFCEGGYLTKQEFKGIKRERVKGLCEIRSALLDVVNIQSREYQNGELEAAQKKLNEVYDFFVDDFGYINDKANSAVFNNDDQYPLLRSIEDLNEDRKTYSKAPIFTKATIKSYRQPTHADCAKEALEISLNMKLKVDLAYMAHLYEKTEDEIIAELGDRIYLNPQNYYGNPLQGWETAEEYLSGDVVSKLEYAKLKAQDNEMFARNVTALEAVQPSKLLPSDIDFRIGSPWIPIEYYRKFMYETFETSAQFRPDEHDGYAGSNSSIELDYLEYTDIWRISNKGWDSGSVKANQEYGTNRANAYEIYEDCLNMQSVTIRDPVKYLDGNGREQTKYVINANDTMIARSKQQQIKEAFASWLFADKDRAETLLDIYNERFNRIRPREYDGSHLRFDGLSEERELRQHQKDVIARIVYNGTCLMAHEVGAGKTAAMVAAGMYMKNMGVIKKPIYVVPNHLTEQWSNEFMRFFPSANILVTTKADFEKKNRNKFVSKIAMGDYDAIIIGHSQFEKIPVSRERQERLLNQEISALTRIIEQMKLEKGENWAIKQIVIFQNNLKERLARLIKEERKDDLLNFEQLGVDYMFVDEAHVYKNCYTYTKMRNVAGIGQSKSQRAADMLMKCQYLQEVNNGRGITFATGTPISNSMSEMYVMQRFLQPDILKKTGLHFFDKWAATFGDTISSLEINPEGSGYRIKNRFSKFHNLPELMKLFRVIADIQTGDMLNLPVPEIEGGKAKVIVTERSAFQKEIMESFVERAEAIRKREVDPETDNMLKLTNEAKLMAIDPRLVYSDAPNDHDSKLNTAIRNVFDIWQDTSDERLTQVIFSDSGTPKPDQFNVYDEVKEQLIDMGVPAAEIAFVHDAKTDAQREAMFEKTRKGEIRVLLGSTSKLGTGTNIRAMRFHTNTILYASRGKDHIVLKMEHFRVNRNTLITLKMTTDTLIGGMKE